MPQDAELVDIPMMQHGDEEISDERTSVQRLLRPAPIDGIENWGIPPEPVSSCDLDVEAKLSQFHTLKHDPTNPKHFNDSLMSNRSFRNPHLYTKLVEFVDVDERATNFPRDVWDPDDVKEEWFASRIAESQKARSEHQSQIQSQIATKRARLDFTSGSASSSQSLSGARDGGIIKKSRFDIYGNGFDHRDQRRK